MSIDLLEKSIDNLKKSWRIFASTLELKTLVSVTQRQRMVSLSLDIIAFSDIFIESHNRHLDTEKKQSKRTLNYSLKELSEDWKNNAESVMNSLHRLVVSYKVMYFFIRALQDATYSVLLELIGKKASKYSSMEKCVNNENNPIHKEISRSLPEYFSWFTEFRCQRNKIKEGITAGGGYKPSSDLLTINMHVVREDLDPALIDIDFNLNSLDIVKAIDMSVALLQFGDNLAGEFLNRSEQ